jgi:hypothetical protein
MRALARAPAERQATAKIFADELRGAVGFASAADIVNVLHATCGQKLAARARHVAVALAGRDSSPSVGDARATVSERGSARDARATMARSDDEDAAATIDMRRQQAVTAPAMQLRDHSIVVGRATPTSESAVAEPPPSIVAPSRFTTPTPPPVATPPTSRGSHVRTAIIAGGIAAAVTAIVVVVVLNRRASTPPPRPDPVVRSEPSEHGLGEIDRLRGGLEEMRDNLHAMRDRLHGDKPVDAGTLVIASDGPTKIYTGDKLLGETPLKVDLAPGTYPIRAVHADGRERSWSVEIAAGQTTTSDRVKTW